MRSSCVSLFRDAALAAAKNGYSVIPIIRGSKRPSVSGWERWAKAGVLPAEGIIEEWAATHHEAGIAVACGAVVGVDIDSDDPRVIEAVRSVLPHTIVEKRGRKGVTLFYRNAHGERSSAINDRPGNGASRLVDILSTGRYCVIPPSIHPETGQPYEWCGGPSLYTLPIGWLPEFPAGGADAIKLVLEEAGLRQPSATVTLLPLPLTPSTPANEADAHRVRAYAEAALRNEAEALAAAFRGTRNDTLHKAVCRLGRWYHHGVLSLGELEQALWDACITNGLAVDDGQGAFRKTVVSGLEASNRDPMPTLAERDHPDVRAALALMGTAPAQGVAQDPLAIMNERHCCLTHEGGKFRVATWDSDGSTILQSKEDFAATYMHRLIDRTSLGKWWLNHPGRREYRALRFDPSKPLEFEGYLNQWRGWPVKAVKGDWSQMYGHIWHVLANGNEDHARYILHWLAWGIQHPERVGEVALIFRGGEGTGKGTLANTYQRLWGPYGARFDSAERLLGRFNAQLRHKCFIFLDEAVIPGDRKSEGLLKSFLTEPTVNIEAKGLDTITETNRLKVIAASNEEWIVPAGIDSRRFAIFDVSGARRGDHGYFKSLHHEIANGGLEAMMNDLQGVNIGDWNPRHGVPQTKALSDQRERSLRGFERVIFEWLSTATIPVMKIIQTDGSVIVKNRDLQEWIERQRRDGINMIVASRILTSLGYEKHRNENERWTLIPPLTMARARWNDRRFHHDWEQNDRWE